MKATSITRIVSVAHNATVSFQNKTRFIPEKVLLSYALILILQGKMYCTNCSQSERVVNVLDKDACCEQCKGRIDNVWEVWEFDLF
jgi:hypothetical protein